MPPEKGLFLVPPPQFRSRKVFWTGREGVGRLFSQADAYPLKYRCPQDFLRQQSPYLSCCQPLTGATWIPDDLQGYCNNLPPLPSGPEVLVYPGADYLLAYWMGRYYGFLRPED